MTDINQLADLITDLSMLEASSLVKSLENRLGVSAQQAQSLPVIVPQSEPIKEEQTEFSVVLKSTGPTKINVIKAVRELTTLGLKEAKDFVESLPGVVKEGISKEEAEMIQKKLSDAGATAEVK